MAIYALEICFAKRISHAGVATDIWHGAAKTKSHQEGVEENYITHTVIFTQLTCAIQMDVLLTAQAIDLSKFCSVKHSTQTLIRILFLLTVVAHTNV